MIKGNFAEDLWSARISSWQLATASLCKIKIYFHVFKLIFRHFWTQLSLNGNDIPKLRVYLNTVALKTYNPGAIISKVVSFKVHEKYNKKTNVLSIFKNLLLCPYFIYISYWNSGKWYCFNQIGWKSNNIVSSDFAWSG